MVEPLRTSGIVDEGLRAALPAPTAALTVSVVEDLRILALRFLPGGKAAVEASLVEHGGVPLPKPGECLGADPWRVWTGPTECLLLVSNRAVADGVLQSLAPGRAPLACAVDRSDGCVVFDLAGPGDADLLPRLLDASAIPQQVGRGHRTRCLDIGAVLLRVAPDRVLLVVDRMHGLYVAQWIGHTLQAAVDDAASFPGAPAAEGPAQAR